MAGKWFHLWRRFSASGISALKWALAVSLLAFLTACSLDVKEDANQKTSEGPRNQVETVSVDLRDHEAKGGHLISRHVGKSDQELIERLNENPGISAASTFTDLSTAEKVVETTLSEPENVEKINHWLKHPRGNLVLNYPGDGKTVIGRGIQRGSNRIENYTRAKIILKSDRKGGYYILTGYPEE
ncbi:RNase A-like domain-containing protein [Lihuaxuella thermophila]|uniref:Bacterial CdiA-CT RNAse A domain-containing protein n=1 Tax=Lihuaxuella thermophila TaxID=1173111 RepID=A0A1H8HSC4_9BACL|nr:RNase A-like domain-containing protein [Lihuaxuella thermophila]SEN58967.1 hypothetical protein SAMN05444955_11517 [Lihuaxuella thermophila]